MFKGILIEKDGDNYSAALKDVDESQLPEGDVTIAVEYSTINYKDALAVTGRGKIIRNFPMVPGIDMAGEVIESDNPGFKPGDKVLLNGWGVGERHWGGLAEKARVKGDWLIPLPEGLSAKRAMAIGTAGYTAMLCVLALEENNVKPEDGEILVTGATGGVGSFAVSLLARAGYTVVAMSGKKDAEPYLKELGATEVFDRAEYSDPGRPLLKERWAGVVDVAGGHILANACAATKYGGTVTACGLANGMDFPATVAPFILRGVTLAGIDSVMCPVEKRMRAWNRLSLETEDREFDLISHEIGLEDVPEISAALLDGKLKGRQLVRIG